MKSKTPRPINLNFGCLEIPLTRQLPPLGFSKDRARTLQKRAEAITTLLIGGLLTDCEVHRCRLRLIHRIEHELRGGKVRQ